MKSFLLLCTGVILALFLVPAPSSGADDPVQIVENYHSTLLSVMKEAERLEFSGRYDRLAPVISAVFDFPFMSKVIMGRYWPTFSSEERADFVEAFRKLSISIYAGRLDGYSGQRFEVVSLRKARRGRVMVQSVLIKSYGDEIDLAYILRKNENRWYIINVVAEGVSELSLRRADYTAYFKRNGFRGLLDKLNEKISDYAN